jgi:hypothetical protein
MKILHKKDGRSSYIPYATTCSRCKRLRNIWSKKVGILFDKECKCQSHNVRSDQGDGIYD